MLEAPGMTITRLKAKNQITLPQKVVKRLGLIKGELFHIEIEGNYLKLTPVEVLPKYSEKELKKADESIKKEKHKSNP
jgi:bifunctional DNA-binding transcriptional regulator/antitoxin component of YhaV-PrlF toxin-antitoxin module